MQLKDLADKALQGSLLVANIQPITCEPMWPPNKYPVHGWGYLLPGWMATTHGRDQQVDRRSTHIAQSA